MAVDDVLNAAWPLVATFVVGLILGLFFFGGLWLTVRQLTTTTRPGLLFTASFLARTAVVIAGIYWAGAGEWQRMTACLVGFIVVRAILTRRLGPSQIVKADGSTS